MLAPPPLLAESAPPSRAQRLAALADQVRAISSRGRPRPTVCRTGWPALDEMLGGGLPTGAIHELISPLASAPLRSIALLAAADALAHHHAQPSLQSADPSVPARHDAFTMAIQNPKSKIQNDEPPSPPARWALFIDTLADFYPPAAAQFGLPLQQLLVVDAPAGRDALWVCEQALRCPSVAAVILPLRTLDAIVSRRLQLAAEHGGGIGLLLLSEQPRGPTFAASRLRFDTPPGAPASATAGASAGPGLLVTVLKLRDRQPLTPRRVVAAGDWRACSTRN
jgi:hypothetical protein